jgi:nicotinamide-nucleotide amidase
MVSDKADLAVLAERVIAGHVAAGRRIAIAESCTGGLICGALTEVAGASAVVERGWVTYSNLAKQQELGVGRDILIGHGAVSAETVAAMARGALERSGVEVAIAVTGIAGPSGGTPDKPVGLVYLGLALRGGDPPRIERAEFGGDRRAVRNATVRRALELLIESLD